MSWSSRRNRSCSAAAMAASVRGRRAGRRVTRSIVPARAPGCRTSRPDAIARASGSAREVTVAPPPCRCPPRAAGRRRRPGALGQVDDAARRQAHQSLTGAGDSKLALRKSQTDDRLARRGPMRGAGPDRQRRTAGLRSVPGRLPSQESGHGAAWKSDGPNTTGLADGSSMPKSAGCRTGTGGVRITGVLYVLS